MIFNYPALNEPISSSTLHSPAPPPRASCDFCEILLAQNPEPPHIIGGFQQRPADDGVFSLASLHSSSTVTVLELR